MRRRHLSASQVRLRQSPDLALRCFQSVYSARQQTHSSPMPSKSLAVAHLGATDAPVITTIWRFTTILKATSAPTCHIRDAVFRRRVRPRNKENPRSAHLDHCLLVNKSDTCFPMSGIIKL